MLCVACGEGVAVCFRTDDLGVLDPVCAICDAIISQGHEVIRHDADLDD